MPTQNKPETNSRWNQPKTQNPNPIQIDSVLGFEILLTFLFFIFNPIIIADLQHDNIINFVQIINNKVFKNWSPTFFQYNYSIKPQTSFINNWIILILQSLLTAIHTENTICGLCAMSNVFIYFFFSIVDCTNQI